MWDIYSQVGKWVWSTAASNPFLYASNGQLKVSPVQHVYGFGYSQTGGFLYDYINGIQPLVVQADGKSMYDGYIVAVAGGDSPASTPSISANRPRPWAIHGGSSPTSAFRSFT